MSNKTPAADLFEMAKAMDRIAAYLDGMDEAMFCASLIAYDAVLMNLIVIGEAASRLPRDVIAAEPSIPWGDVIGMRNRIAHGYEDIQPKRIWDMIQSDLPSLRDAVQRLLGAFPPP
jgi:uncharacterized protein with HEPN domain